MEVQLCTTFVYSFTIMNTAIESWDRLEVMVFVVASLYLLCS